MRAAAWWRGLTLRTRLVTGSVVPLAVALLVGTAALAGIFASGRLAEVDRQTAAESRVLIELVSSGQVPSPLPVPAGSTLLAQVVKSGRVLAASASASRLLPLVADSQTGVRTLEEPPIGQVPMRVRVVAVESAGGVTVVVAAPLGDVRRATRALRLVLLVVVPALVAAATVLARLLVGLALRPVEALRVSAAALASGPVLERRLLDLPAHEDELHRLALTFNDVLARLHHSVEQQKAFVADAAHELRSPLASLRLQLDVAGRHPHAVDTAALVGELTPEVDRLAALADDLLLLARLDARVAVEHPVVDLATLADSPTEPVPVRGDEQELRRLHRNLTENASRYATRVETSVGVETGWAVLDVDDDGPGIPVDDRLRVFDRWVRLDTGRGRTEGGAGLGLAVARDIAVSYGGSLEVLDSPLGGARLRLRLPLAG